MAIAIAIAIAISIVVADSITIAIAVAHPCYRWPLPLRSPLTIAAALSVALPSAIAVAVPVAVALSIGHCCWNPPKWVHMKCTLTKSGSTGTERMSHDESRRGTPYLLLTGPMGSYV